MSVRSLRLDAAGGASKRSIVAQLFQIMNFGI